jgi:hypothetical protein
MGKQDVPLVSPRLVSLFWCGTGVLVEIRTKGLSSHQKVVLVSEKKMKWAEAWAEV